MLEAFDPTGVRDTVDIMTGRLRRSPEPNAVSGMIIGATLTATISSRSTSTMPPDASPRTIPILQPGLPSNRLRASERSVCGHPAWIGFLPRALTRHGVHPASIYAL